MVNYIIIMVLLTTINIRSMDNRLALVLKKHFDVPQRKIARKNKVFEAEMHGKKKITLVNNYVTQLVTKTLNKAYEELKTTMTRPDKLNLAYYIVTTTLGGAQGIISKKKRIEGTAGRALTVNVKKLVKYYPENIKKTLLDECEDIACPLCNNYFKEEFKNPDDSMVEKRTVLACAHKHAFCPDDLMSYVERNRFFKGGAYSCPECDGYLYPAE
ncbi:hypothetical protein Noda2021_05420 [Candidatus Dependentiae bacterium Noda2021]|nr:hypothetical protein Noda2021_05420 [Candidatus Dependentiae bacterium Noda2021]